jgi:hypothetical protein
MAAIKSEFDNIFVEITHDIGSSTDYDAVSTARSLDAEAQEKTMKSIGHVGTGATGT